MKFFLFFTLIFPSLLFAQYQGIGGESLSSEVISKYAPKAIPSELSKKIQTILDIRSPSPGMISPDGKKLFFTWRVTGQNQIWRLDAPNSFPVQMTGGEERTSILDIAPNGKFIILSRDQNGEENQGLYLQDISGGPLKIIQHLPKIQTNFQFVSSDSKSIYFSSNDLSPESYAIYRYDIPSQKKELIFSQKGLWTISDVKNNSDFIFTRLIGSKENESFFWNIQEKKLVPIIGQEQKGDYTVLFSRKKDEYLVVTNALSDFEKFYLLKGKKLEEIFSKDGQQIMEIFSDRKKERFYALINDGGYYHTKAFSFLNFKEIPLPKIPESDQTEISWVSPNGRFISFASLSDKKPRESFIFDWQTQKMTKWFSPSIPEVDISHYIKASLEYYPALDGTKIPMFVRIPSQCEEKFCPVIISFHGGPEGQSRPGFSPYVQLFLDEGFIFIEPNVRGSDGYGKKWLDSDNGPKRLDVISDIEAASKFAREHFKKDGKTPKIGIMGGSYGGYSTLIGMTMFAGSYDAGVASVGMSNLVTFLQNTAPYRRALRTSEYGDLQKDLEALKKLSPINYIDKIKGPLLIIQGVNDPRVPAGEAVQIYEVMKKKGLESELILFSDEGHGASKRSNQVLDIGHELLFFKKHLKN